MTEEQYRKAKKIKEKIFEYETAIQDIKSNPGDKSVLKWTYSMFENDFDNVQHMTRKIIQQIRKEIKKLKNQFEKL